MERSGILLIDKPSDMTSHDVVGKVRKILRQTSIGHTGTLDPMATGLMVLVLGEATKLSDYLVSADKTYLAKVRLGVTTDSLDRTGRVLTEVECDLSPEHVQGASLNLQGEFEWPVPVFSAMKVDGRRLYEHGHKGEIVETPNKLMRFWDIEVQEVDNRGVAVVLTCSKGSFIRSWASQLGANLGVGGVLEDLRRLRVGSWDLKSATTLAALAGSPEDLGAAFVPLAQALPKWKPMLASAKEAKLMRNGQIPKDMANRLVFEQKQAFSSGAPVLIKVVSEMGDLLAILAAEPGQGLKIRRVFRSIA